MWRMVMVGVVLQVSGAAAVDGQGVNEVMTRLKMDEVWTVSTRERAARPHWTAVGTLSEADLVQGPGICRACL